MGAKLPQDLTTSKIQTRKRFTVRDLIVQSGERLRQPKAHRIRIHRLSHQEHTGVMLESLLKSFRLSKTFK
jgi:hypothetical protein